MNCYHIIWCRIFSHFVSFHSDVWGFDEEAVKVLQDMKPEGTDDLINEYAILLDENSPLRIQLENEENVSEIIIRLLYVRCIESNVSW